MMDARKVLNDAQKNVVDACDAEAWIGPHYPLHQRNIYQSQPRPFQKKPQTREQMTKWTVEKPKEQEASKSICESCEQWNDLQKPSGHQQQQGEQYECETKQQGKLDPQYLLAVKDVCRDDKQVYS